MTTAWDDPPRIGSASIGPNDGAVDPMHDDRYMWLWFVIPVLVSALVVSLAVVVWPPRRQAGPGCFFLCFTPPTPKNWHPDTTSGAVRYCSNLSLLSGPLPDPQWVGVVVNEAPTVAAHNATLRFYNDLKATSTPTSQLNSDLAAVYASYPCGTSGESGP